MSQMVILVMKEQRSQVHGQVKVVEGQRMGKEERRGTATNAYSKRVLFLSFFIHTEHLLKIYVLARVAIEGCKSLTWLVSTAKSRASSVAKILGNEWMNLI